MKKRYVINKDGTATAKYFGPRSKVLKNPELFDDEEGTFIDNHNRRRVVVHLVPAPWSRVFVYSIFYAFAVAAVQEVWFWHFGKPNLWPAYQSQPAQIELKKGLESKKGREAALSKEPLLKLGQPAISDSSQKQQ